MPIVPNNNRFGTHLQSWPLPLSVRHGGSSVSGIRIYHDFIWSEHVKHGRTTFRGGKHLTKRISDRCPIGKSVALLLTCRTDSYDVVLESDSECVVAIDIDTFLAGEWWDPLA